MNKMSALSQYYKQKHGLATQLLAVVLSWVVLLLNGFALQACWAWFVLPVFSLPPLPLVVAMGLPYVYRFVSMSYCPPLGEEQTETLDPSMRQFVYLIGGAMTFLIAWVLHFFM